MIMNMRTRVADGKDHGPRLFQGASRRSLRKPQRSVARALSDVTTWEKLAAGALADILIIDFSGRNSLRYGPVRDPIKSLVECGVGDDIDTVIVNGNICIGKWRDPGPRPQRLARTGTALRRAHLGNAAGLGPSRTNGGAGKPVVVSAALKSMPIDSIGQP